MGSELQHLSLTFDTKTSQQVFAKTHLSSACMFTVKLIQVSIAP